MNTCKVTFENSNEQQVIVILSLNKEKNELDMKLGFSPKVDPHTDLGLAGQFADIFCKALGANNESTPSEKQQ